MDAGTTLTYDETTSLFTSPPTNQYPVDILIDGELLTLTPCETIILPTIDIKPGGSSNPINLTSKGTIPVAIVSSIGFDATEEVEKTSLTFGRTGNEQSFNKCSEDEDVNDDGLMDVVCHFHAQETAFQDGDTSGVLKSFTKGSVAIQGTNAIRLVPDNEKGAAKDKENDDQKGVETGKEKGKGK